MSSDKIDKSKVTLPLEWPDDEKVMEKVVMDILRTFDYGENMFIPAGTIEQSMSLREITKYLSSDRTLGIWSASYKDVYGTPKTEYTHADFYKASGNFPCDVFKCLDNCKFYLPGENEVFLYTGEYTPINNRLLMHMEKEDK